MAKRQGGLVSQVADGSLAAHLGILPGDAILSVNGRKIHDELDFRFFAADEDIALLVRKRDGSEECFEIEKDAGEPLGVTFSEQIFDSVKTCRNNCTFCFLKQIPREMRKTLHIRDDDYRLSFLYGNFLSLTNMEEADWRRLREQRLSPLRVSVHATDPALREELMGNPRAALIMDDLRRLKEIGLTVHVQIVLLQGVNDGEHLKRTLDDLDSLGDTIASVGVVPAVYTRYRRVPPSPRVTPAWAGEVVDATENYGRSMQEKRGSPWVYCADEFYIVAGREFPSYEYYGEFDQYENGIGLIPEWRHRLPEAKAAVTAAPGASAEAGGGGAGGARPRTLVVTGKMAADEIKRSIVYLGLSDVADVCVVPNTFFGETVTVAGLLTGQDILGAVFRKLREADTRYNRLLVPEVAVFEGRFLDDLRLESLSEALGMPVHCVKTSPEVLVQAVQFGEE